MWALNLARKPTTVADLASELNLPLGVVRILLADLRDSGFIVIRSPEAGQGPRDTSILREVLNGLRAL
jgi:DNA-binding IscR family transcriptional regulator